LEGEDRNLTLTIFTLYWRKGRRLWAISISRSYLPALLSRQRTKITSIRTSIW